MLRVQENAQGITFAVRVQPRTRRNGVVGEIDGMLKLSLTTPPVDGRANQVCIDFLAELLDVPRSSIKIIAGQTSRKKVVRLQEISAAEIRSKIESAF